MALQQFLMKDSDSNGEWTKRKTIKKEKFHECGCGKKYKVQASLDAHILKQHQGISPGPVKMPEKSNRGRPKNTHFHNFNSTEEVNPLEELAKLRNQWRGKDGELKEFYEKEPVYLLITKYKDPQQAKNHQKVEPKFIEEDKIYQMSMGRGLLVLMDELKTMVPNQNFLDELKILITTYISYMIEQTEDQNVLSNGSIGLLPQFINYFLIYDFQKRCERLKIKDLWINHIPNVIKIFSLFFRWLNYKKYTHTRATINQDYTNKFNPQTQFKANLSAQKPQEDICEE